MKDVMTFTCCQSCYFLIEIQKPNRGEGTVNTTVALMCEWVGECRGSGSVNSGSIGNYVISSADSGGSGDSK